MPRSLTFTLSLLLALSLAACGGRRRGGPGDGDDDDDDDVSHDVPLGDGDADTDADVDADGDADVDADGDADTDADVDADGDADTDADADGDVEVCNGRDDDGDGIADEGNPGGGQVCETDEPGRCAPGRTFCEGGRLGCDPDNAPRAEQCSNARVDDDCNGIVDDVPGLDEPCDTGMDGACSDGTGACQNNAYVCVADDLDLRVEVCDNFTDEDCDGRVDEAGCEDLGDELHHDGYGNTWVDGVAVGTYDVVQATRACEAYVEGMGVDDVCISQGCSCGGGGDECVFNDASGGGSTHVWFYAGTYVGNTTANSCAYGAIWD